MATRRELLHYTAALILSMKAVAAVGASAASPALPAPGRPLRSRKIPNTDLNASALGWGSGSLVPWNKNPLSAEELTQASRLINTALEQGITLFDHADIYAFGRSEAAFGQVLKQSPGLRQKIVLQSKCGQLLDTGPGKGVRVDLSRRHIEEAVEGSLGRLGTDRLDVLLLHAPDALAAPEEIAQAFDHLHSSGKVRYFGVSNHNAAQIALLKKFVRQPLVVNQIQIGLANPGPLAQGIDFTLRVAKDTLGQRDTQRVDESATVDYCRLNDIQLQAWSPLRGLLNPKEDASPQIKSVWAVLEQIAKRRNSTPAVVALGWLLRHPAGILPIIGGDKPEYIIENIAADRFEMSREEWYDLLVAAT